MSFTKFYLCELDNGNYCVQRKWLLFSDYVGFWPNLEESAGPSRSWNVAAFAVAYQRETEEEAMKMYRNWKEAQLVKPSEPVKPIKIVAKKLIKD